MPEPRQRRFPACPVCFGSGQITGPKSMVYRSGATDPWYAQVRLCDECEGTGVVTAVRAAGIEAASMQKVLPIVDKIMGEVRADRVALDRWEAEGGYVA